MGIDPAKSQIIFNQLQERLSAEYALVSQAEVEEAFEKAVKALPGEQCTEENCLVLVQEYLKLNLVFNLQLIRDQESSLTQLTLRAVSDKRRFIKTENCEGCNLNELRDSLEKLTERLMADRGRDIHIISNSNKLKTTI